MASFRYYYALVECDSVKTAAAIYQQCDGHEFEKSANIMDLRYVPDEMEFVDPPRFKLKPSNLSSHHSQYF
jgi:hypothetical protein